MGRKRAGTGDGDEGRTVGVHRRLVSSRGSFGMSCPGNRQKTHVTAEVGGCPWLSTVGRCVCRWVGGLPCLVKGGGTGGNISSRPTPSLSKCPPLRLFVSFARPSSLEERLSVIVAEAVLLVFASRSPLTGRACLLFASPHYQRHTLVAFSFDSTPVDDSLRDDDDKRTRPPHISHPTWFAVPPGSPEKDVADSRTPSFRRSPPPTRPRMTTQGMNQAD